MILNVRSLPPPAPPAGGRRGEDRDGVGDEGRGGEGGEGVGTGGGGHGGGPGANSRDGVSGFGNYRRGLAPPSRPWKQLLDSSFEEAPSTGLGRNTDDYLSETVDRSAAAGINPTTVRLLRTWLFGSPVALPGVGDGLSNYSLTSFVVQAGLGDGVHSSYRYAGPIWTCDESVMAAMRDNGVWARVLAEEHLPSDASPHRLRRTWVDHAVRAATCTMSTLDLYYHRRDPEGEKRD